MVCAVAQAESRPTRWAVVVDPAVETDGRWGDALRATVSLVRADAQVGLSVQETEPREVPVLPVSNLAHVQQLHRALKGLASESRFTLQDGLDAGLRLLGSRSPTTDDRLLVVFTGRAGEADGRAELEELVADATVRRVRLHLISSGPVTDRVRELAESTGGRVDRVSDGQVVGSLVQAASWAGDAELLTLDAGAMWIDEHVDRATVTLIDQRPGPHRLILPDETVLEAEASRGVGWTKGVGFEQVELRSPPYGAWRLEQSGAPSQALVVVNYSALRLELQLEPQIPVLGAPVRIQGRMLEGGQPVVSYARLKNLRMTAFLAGEPVVLEPTGEGRFLSDWVPTQEGPMEVMLRAESPDLRRTLRRLTHVQAPCFDVTADFEGRAIRVQAALRSVCGQLREVQIDVAPVAAAGQLPWVRLRPTASGSLMAEMERPEGLERLVFEARAFSRLGERTFPLPSIRAPEPDRGLPWPVQAAASQTPLILLWALWRIRRRLDEHVGLLTSDDPTESTE